MTQPADSQPEPPEVKDPEITLSEVFNKPDPTDDEFRLIITALRARRNNFAQLETAKSKGEVSKRTRKLPGASKTEKAAKELEELGFDLNNLDDLFKEVKP